jgi:hypothetical protein
LNEEEQAACGNLIYLHRKKGFAEQVGKLEEVEELTLKNLITANLSNKTLV